MATEVQIYCVEVGELLGEVDNLSRALSADELARANRHHFETHRNSFIIRRGVLRSLLGRYLDVEPGQVRLVYGQWGKPVLDLAPHHSSNLQFNVAHSRDITLLAFAWGKELGVDVEYLRLLPDAEQIATRFFSATEQQALRSLPPEQRTTAFHKCWTRKEAYIKALGLGLSIPLDSFAVSLTPGEPARLLHVAGEPGEASRWSFLSWEPSPGYLAALAMEGGPISPSWLRLSSDLLRR